MARTLNTSDPLYGNLTALIILDDDDVTVKELVGGATLTRHANVRLPGSGTPSDGTPYGRSFEPSGTSDGNTIHGVTLPTAISVPTNAAMSVFFWHNGYVDTNTGWAAYTRMMANGITAGRHIGPGFQFDPADGKMAPCSINGALALATLSAVKSASDARPAGSIAFTRNGSNPLKLWINGARDANYSGSGMAISTGAHGGPQANSELGVIGGMQTWSRWSWCGIAIFVGYELTDSDYARLHSGLGVDTMPLLASPAATLSGGHQLDDATISGALLSSSSLIGGSVDLSDLSASGALSVNPAAWSVPALTNWGGSVQGGITVPLVTFLRVSDGAQVLTLSNVSTDASGNLSGTSGLLTPGVAYMAIGWSADGSARFARPITPT